MYRILFLLVLCFEQSLTAPQQGGIETIADVKPTIFDYPAEVYDVPASYPIEASPINGGRQDFGADDFKYGITTDNIDLETIDYNEDATDSYDRITESIIPHDYESRENIAEIYSKLGYFTSNYLPGHNKNNNQPKDAVNKLKYTETIHNTSDDKTINSTKDKASKTEDTTVHSEGKRRGDESIVEIKTDFSDTKQNQENRQNLNESTTNYIKNIANIVEDKPSYEMSKPSYFSIGRKAYSTNLLHKAGRRKFRSNCRCEKIWNCPKLQISVPRCPDEYFMCCF